METVSALKRKALRAYRLGLDEYEQLMEELSHSVKSDKQWEKVCGWIDERGKIPLNEREEKRAAKYKLQKEREHAARELKRAQARAKQLGLVK